MSEPQALPSVIEQALALRRQGLSLGAIALRLPVPLAELLALDRKLRTTT